MKKLLALVLALVMTLSLATVSTNAAFEDAADISYEEAANVLSAVGVFVGDGKNFAPKAELNREQAAKLVAYMALGEDVAEALPAVAMFDDVATSSWAAKYIAFCADAGIITGDGAGKFFPTAPVSGYAFAKMLMCALGYEAEAEGFTGGNWEINVATKAKELGISETAIKMNGNLTREQAAQLMLNAIQCKKITRYDNTGSSVTIGNVVVNQAWGNPVEGEYYYIDQWDSQLRITDANAKDEFGRDATEWTYKTDVVSCAANDTADFVVTKNMTVKEIAAMLKGYKVGEYKITADTVTGGGSVAVDSFSCATSTESLVDAFDDEFVDGKAVELYFDSNNKLSQFVVIDYSFDKVVDIDTDAKTGAVTYDFETAPNYTNDADTTEVVFAGAVAEGDYVTTFAGKDTFYVYPTTKFSGALTSYTNTGVYTIGGQAYTKSEAFSGNDLAIGDTANYYLDQYGFIVKTDAITTSSSNYALVMAYDIDSDVTFGTYAPALKVKVLLADGTVGIYDLKTAKKSGSYYVVDADGAIVVDTKLNAGSEEGVVAGLVGNVYSYVVSGNTIALKNITTVAQANKVFKTAMNTGYNNTDASYIAKNDTVLESAYDSSNDVTMNAKTTFIFWDAEDEKATVVVGNDKLGDKQFGSSAANKIVASANDDATAFTAKYVFVMENSANVTEATDKYGYVDFSKYVATKDGEDNIRTYTMTLADGSKLSVIEKNSFSSGDGLFEYNTDNTVGDAVVNHVFEDVCVSFADGVAKFNSGAAYTVAENFKLIDLSDDNNGLEDSLVIAVLDEDTDKVIEVAYIFDAPAGFVEGGVAYIGDTYYTSLQAALDAAVDGDEIYVLPGTISEDLKLLTYYNEPKSVTIYGANYANNPNTDAWNAANETVLTGGLWIGDAYEYNQSARYDRLHAKPVVIKGIHFQGEGLSIGNRSAVTVENNKFSNITATLPGTYAIPTALGIANMNYTDTPGDYSNGGDAYIVNNRIEGTGSGGNGIDMRDAHNAVISGNYVIGVGYNAVSTNNLDFASTPRQNNGATGNIEITNNVIMNWGSRAYRANINGADITFTGNTLIHEDSTLPSGNEFAKISVMNPGTLACSGNTYKVGANPVLTDPVSDSVFNNPLA